MKQYKKRKAFIWFTSNSKHAELHFEILYLLLVFFLAWLYIFVLIKGHICLFVSFFLEVLLGYPRCRN